MPIVVIHIANFGALKLGQVFRLFNTLVTLYWVYIAQIKGSGFSNKRRQSGGDRDCCLLELHDEEGHKGEG